MIWYGIPMLWYTISMLCFRIFRKRSDIVSYGMVWYGMQWDLSKRPSFTEEFDIFFWGGGAFLKYDLQV